MKLLYLFTTLFLFILFSGCTKQSSNEGTSNNKQPSNFFSELHAFNLIHEGKVSEGATELTQIGELLLLPKGLEFADEMFEKALKADARHPRALFLSAMLKPWLPLKGIGPRLHVLQRENKQAGTMTLGPVANEMSYASQRFAFAAGGTVDMPKLHDFLNKPDSTKQPFSNHQELQAFILSDFLPALQLSADRTGTLVASDTMFKVTFDPGKWGKLNRDFKTHYYKDDQCYRSGNSWNCYNYYSSHSRYTETSAAETEVTVDKFDAKVLRSALLGAIDHLRLNTAYSLEGYDAFTRELAVAQKKASRWGRRVTTEEIVGMIKKHPALFTLNANHQLGLITDSTTEVIRHMLDLANIDREFCQGDRRKYNLFATICVTTHDVPGLMLSLDLLAGPRMIQLGLDEDGAPVEILLDIRSVLASPSKDLKALLPTKFDRRGDPLEFPDKTLGGLFPNGDLFDKLREIGNKAGQVN